MRKSPRHSGLVLAGVVVGLLGAFLLLRFLAAKWAARTERAKEDAMAVFHALAQRHRLQRAEVSVLAEVAAHFSLTDPGVLFARPTVFDRTLERHLRAIGDDDLRCRAVPEVSRLRTKIFGSIDAGAESAAFDENDYHPLIE